MFLTVEAGDGSLVKFVTASRVKLLRSEVCAVGAREVFTFGESDDMSASNSIILQNCKLVRKHNHNCKRALHS